MYNAYLLKSVGDEYANQFCKVASGLFDKFVFISSFKPFGIPNLNYAIASMMAHIRSDNMIYIFFIKSKCDK